MPDTRDEAHVIRPRLVHIAPLLVGVLIAVRASEAIRDNSFLWHIRAGSLQIEMGSVLSEDPFSFTAAGEAWRTQSWLVELVYGGAESAFGSLVWANWLVFGAGIVLFCLMGIAVYQRTPSPLVTTGALLVGVWLFAPFAQARPVIVSYVLLALVVVVLTRPHHLAWTLVPIFWIFAAVHGSWILAGGLVVLEVIRTRNVILLKAGIASLGATLLTAHGIGAWGVLVSFARDRDALALIQEWAPPDFADIAQAPFLLIIVGVLVGLARQRISLADLIVVVPFLAYGLTSQRSVFPAAIVLLPFAATALPVPTPSRETMSRGIVVAAMAAIVLVALLPMLTRPLGVLDPDRFPSDEVVEAVRGTRAFNDTAVGGYLIFDAWPDHTVYIDDRAELYGYDRLAEFRRALAGDYRTLFSDLDIETAVVAVDAPLAVRLAEDGWRPVVTTEAFIAFAP